MRLFSQFGLLLQRDYGLLWVTNMLAKVNNHMVIGLGAGAATAWLLLPEETREPVSTFAPVVFTLSALVLTGVGGNLADCADRRRLVQFAKLVEVPAAICASFWILGHSGVYLLLATCLLGLRSAIFSPARLALIPQYVPTSRLTDANGLMIAGRMLAIIVVFLIGRELGKAALGAETAYLAGVLPLLAVAGLVASLFLPASPSPGPQAEPTWSPVAGTRACIRAVTADRNRFLAVLAMGWFWSYAIVTFSRMPSYADHTLGVDQSATALMMTAWLAGSALGALLCAPLSGRRTELGLVPLGALGLGVAGAVFYLTAPDTPAPLVTRWRDIATAPEMLGVLVNLGFLGLSLPLALVPLYAYLQESTPPHMTGRVMGGMLITWSVAASLSFALALAVTAAGVDTPMLLLGMAGLHVLVMIWIFRVMPEFLLRLVTWLLVHVLYRVKTEGLERIPPDGAAVLVCNHVSYMDALVLMACIRRPVRFVMYKGIFDIPVMSFLFRAAKTIPIASAQSDPDTLRLAMDKVAEELAAERVVCIFPEGRLSKDGEIAQFRKGIERIVERTPVTVVPMALQGFWGSFFSHGGGPALRHWPRLRWSRIGLRVGQPIPPGEVEANDLRSRVAALRGEWA